MAEDHRDHPPGRRVPHRFKPKRGNSNHGQNYAKKQNTDGQRGEQDWRTNPTRRGTYYNDHKNNSHETSDEWKNYPMGFKTLEEIASLEGADIIAKISDKSRSFNILLNSNIEKQDVYVLIMQLIANLCCTSFEQLKIDFLLDICNSKFIEKLQLYLTNLPYAEDKKNNSYYWKNPTKFWENLLCFCNCLIMRSPSTAVQKCRALIEGITKICLEGLKDRHNYLLPKEHELKLTELRTKLLACEKDDVKKIQCPRRTNQLPDEFEEPPEDFRELNILPCRDDFINNRPFLRPNIVEGRYRDVDHYLDVQFRLLREDFIGPLRAGILQFITNPEKRKFDNIRIYSGVKFERPYISNGNVGSLIQFDSNTVKRFKKITWAHSKRFMFGSLIIFTDRHFETIIVATVVDRDEKYLKQGQLSVKILTEDFDNIYNDKTYTMIESEVYFVPYFHVLTAIQDQEFPQHLAMQKYIINVESNQRYPSHLIQNSIYNIELEGNSELENITMQFSVLDNESWPSHTDLGLNESQYEAYSLALTHEFAVIQGPPGTGKTFLGLKVAETLLKNNDNLRMLLICFTNHALDQFLEAILNFTNSVVHVGGQSRSDVLKKYNIKNLRVDGPNPNFSLFSKQQIALDAAVSYLKAKLQVLERVDKGVLTYETLTNILPDFEILAKHYKRENGDIMFQYLFENMKIEEKGPNADDVMTENCWFTQTSEETEAEIHETICFDVVDAQIKLNNLLEQLNQLQQYGSKEEYDLQCGIQILWSEIQHFKKMQIFQNGDCDLQITDKLDPRQFKTAERWAIYFRAVKKVTQKYNLEIRTLLKHHQSTQTAYEEAKMTCNVRILERARVIGMTTTSAARLRKVLQCLKIDIVIVEEAAEVLETHIISALTKHCKHLILIGDHQQLRPSTAHYKLARDFNLEISLFERMIKNNIHSRRLTVQHRMRPEIASLICPSIYPELQNHSTVLSFPDVRGIEKNLFFMTHNFMETSDEDNGSRCNYKEADLTLQLANYLMQQEYNDEDVTILAAYSGQMFYMRKQRLQYAFLKNVKITVVDNYQGEESKIILLSLVRNNKDNKIGFLSTINRVCVALSRAREGFYMFGNIDILKRNADIWEKIAESLEKNGSLGSSLRLKCENHPEQITKINQVEDFNKTPEGGCMLKCSMNLNCGHMCPLVCHGYDRGHVKIKCNLKCERVICELAHICPLMCAEECKPCLVLIDKSLTCGHVKKMYCYQSPDDGAIKCMEMVPVTLPSCKHESRKPCYLPTRLVTCLVPCIGRLNCGHQCSKKCHVETDPEHLTNKCEKPCQRAKKGCSQPMTLDLDNDHRCKRRCHEDCDNCLTEVVKKRSSCKHSMKVPCCEDVNEIQCKQRCARSMNCGHHCKKKCFEKCGDCRQQVEKKIPSCGHPIKVECRLEPTRADCRSKCERILSCGHPCTERCDKPCNAELCTALVNESVRAICGHDVRLPCHLYSSYKKGNVDPTTVLRHCRAPCPKLLECEHSCSGSCGECRQGRVHAPCRALCDRPSICGHLCKEPCNKVCPPCSEPCEVKCVHSRCSRKCGIPCSPCREKCTRSCPHGRCSRRCDEPCSVPPCDRACPNPLPCGHPCRGLCGEPCPDICKLCRPEQFPTDFLGYEYEDNEKFIKLEDCSHYLTVEDMDNLMMGDRTSIDIRACPFCRKPIINSGRYKDIINSTIKELINPVKEKVYGSRNQIIAKKKEIFLKFESLLLLNSTAGNTHWKRAYYKISTIMRNLGTTKKLPSLIQLEMHSIYMNILDIIGDCHNDFMKSVRKEAKILVEMRNQIEFICDILIENSQKISGQTQKDISIEIKRMYALSRYSKILSNDQYYCSRNESKVMEAERNALTIIKYWGIYDDDAATVALDNLEKSAKASVHVTQVQRSLIVKALGLKQGQWFKCPNGHIYCITECGGAMEEGTCNECGAQIGGKSHKLRSDNQLATEMDGAIHPAWSDQYNNMQNYDF